MLWDYSTGQEFVQIERVSWGGDVLGVVCEIRLAPGVEELVEKIVAAHNADLDLAESHHCAKTLPLDNPNDRE